MANGTLKVQNIQTSSGTGTITLGQSGETVTVPSGVTVSGGVANTPAFYVEATSSQTVSDDVETKVTLDNEIFDSDNAFASNKFTVPSGKDGKYFFHYGIRIESDANTRLNSCNISLYKNGSRVRLHRTIFEGNPIRDMAFGFSTVLDLVADDYIELYGQNNVTSGTPSFDPNETYLGGYKIIGA